jgi:thiamine-phosphate pyrophosphorylase
VPTASTWGPRTCPWPRCGGWWGPSCWSGGTARDPSTARRLVEEGASYLGVGPTFATSSKAALPDPIGVEGVRAVASAVPVPVIAIAGITAQRVDEVMEAGAWGVAVIGAIADAPDPHSATHELMLAVAKAVEALGGGLP